MADKAETKARLIRPIVDIETWLTDKFYVGPEADYIRPYVADFIKEYNTATYINEIGIRVPKRKFLCTGAARTGKSYGARLLLMRILYEMSCYENFPCLFGLSPSTTPKIFWLSYTISKSESTGLKGLIRMVDKVPYFQLPSLKRKPLESELIFPFCEIRSGSNVSHIVGEDMLGCILDEANVRKVAKGTEVEETQKMFQEMRQRSVMTFSKNGIWGGFSGIISSSTTSSSFVALELEKAKKDGDTVIMEASVYEANPEQYSKEKFPVFIGNGTIPPFIVDKIDAVTKTLINDTYGMTSDDYIKNNPQYIEMVPVSIRKFYEEDLSFSLANMSGKVQSGNSFWLNQKYIKTLWNEDKKPFNQELINVGIFDDVDWESLFDETYIMLNYHGENVYIHIDAGLKNDHTGFSALFYNIEEHKINSLLTMECTVNRNIPDNQTDQTKLWEVILLLKKWGANIKLVTGDIWAKSYIIPQAKQQETFTGEYYSVDTDDMAAYLTMYNYMKVGLYSIPYYQQMETELSELQRDMGTGKIDHMNNPNPSEPIHFKDVIDAFAGASFQLFTRENISYDDLIIQRGLEKVQDRIVSDNFYETISKDEEADIEDEMKLFETSLYGEDNDYVSMDLL